MVMALTHRFESECEAVILFGASDNQAVFMMQGTEEWIASAGRGEMSTLQVVVAGGGPDFKVRLSTLSVMTHIAVNMESAADACSYCCHTSSSRVFAEVQFDAGRVEWKLR